MPTTVALAAIAAIGYLVSSARHGRSGFTGLDALILATLMAIVSVTGLPLLNAIGTEAQEVSAMRNLHSLRARIDLYKMDHEGALPLLYRGTFPQLLQATDLQGAPGEAGPRFPFGPYLDGDMPTNTFTGASVVTATDESPPKTPSGNGGWIYNQNTGQIAIDLPKWIEK